MKTVRGRMLSGASLSLALHTNLGDGKPALNQNVRTLDWHHNLAAMGTRRVKVTCCRPDNLSAAEENA
jgi:hypothetical protein